MSDHDFYARFYHSRDNSLKKARELDPYDTEYDQTGFNLGYQWRFLRVEGDVATDGGPVVELGGSAVRGSYGNLGSHRDQFEVSAGWRQDLRLFDRFRVYASPRLGIGWASNRLNFGGGGKLPKERSHNVIIQGEAGVEYCFHPSFCPALFGGYFYEQTVAGSPDYINQGWMLGVGLTVDLFPQESAAVDLEQVRTERDQLRAERDRLSAERGAARADNERLTSENAELRGRVPLVERVEVEVLPQQDRVNFEAAFQFPNWVGTVQRQPELGRGGVVVRRSNPELDRHAAFLKEHPGIRTRLHGHANQAGQEPEALNNILSYQRVLAVWSYLVEEAGIDPSRLVINGHYLYEGQGRERHIVNAEGESVHGSRDPIFPNRENPDPADEGNRCVKFEILSPEVRP